jgi:branched-chain amino acid transport system substrate-binding protein
VRAALVTPLTGPLAHYGKAGLEALGIWADAMPEGTVLEVQDAHPDPAGAVRRAAASSPDVLFGPYGSWPARRVAGATDRLMWNHGGASSELCWPKIPNVVNVPAPAASYMEGALHTVAAADPEARRISLVHVQSGFGREVASGAEAVADRIGLAVHRVDFSARRAGRVTVPPADVLVVAGAFRDEAELASRLLPGSWRWAAFVGAGVEEVLPPELREGLLGPAQWVPWTAIEPDEGPHPRWFSGIFRERTGRPPPYPAAQAFAAGVIWARCAREAETLEEEPILAVARRLTCRTLLGDFRLDPQTGLQVGHRVLTVQWQDGRRRVVWPPEQAEAPVRPRHQGEAG